jgi:hypothetical protein
MSDFAKSFLRDRLGEDGRPRDFFGMFGKHPGWNDHIEDLPLPTASMATAKQLLYVQGIGAQISSGAWTRLEDDAKLPGFDHSFVWLRGDQFLAGRMWASSDGKRRSHFPMIALVHGANLERDRVLGAIFAKLESVATLCRATRSAAKVREVCEGWSAATDVPDADAGRAILHASRVGVCQIVEEFRRRAPAFTRVPADSSNVVAGLRFWSTVCAAFAPAETPLLILVPHGWPWVDVLVGEPAPDRFFCLRAGSALPVAGEAAGDPVEEIDAEELIAHFRHAQAPAVERNWISRLLRH